MADVIANLLSDIKPQINKCVADGIATMADGIAMSVCIFKAGVIAYVCLGGRCYGHSWGIVGLMLLPSGWCYSHYRVVWVGRCYCHWQME